MVSRPVVLVTGAARRVGREIALHLARHGCDLAIHCHHSRDEAAATAAEARQLGQAHGVQAEVFVADLADEPACRALVPNVVAQFGRLDAVVNNASTFEYDSPQTFTQAAMARHWQANTAPAVLLTQALAIQLGQQPAGAWSPAVVNLSDQKLWNPNPDYFSYTLSKAALDAATVMLAQAYAPALRVCGVAPGVTLVSGPMSQAQFQQAHGLTPLKRSSTPQDIARSVLFLLESPAITGTTLLVDGGQHLQGQTRDVLFLTSQRSGTP